MDKERIDKLLVGAVDPHIHSGPGIVPRALDHVEAVREAMDAKFRAVVIKDHHCPTVLTANIIQKYLVGDSNKDFQVFGGLAMNNTTGGVSPYTVEAAVNYGAKIIWMPTLSAENHHKGHANLTEDAKKFMPNPEKELIGDPGLTILDDDGKLLPYMKDILRMIKDADIVLATGHLSKKETNLLLDAAVGIGIKRIMINHPEHLLYATIDEMIDYAKSGFYLEHSITLVHSHKSSYEYIYQMIREAGVDKSLMGSDLGQRNRPHPVEGIRLWAAAMLELGLSDEEVRTVLCKTPADLMGL
ncbi:MAG TPA: DUF6282 family protein [Anaerovoracaceae bacterium]|nr:DUF6282 family protein [Anaerovoracaceae bacterium]